MTLPGMKPLTVSICDPCDKLRDTTKPHISGRKNEGWIAKVGTHYGSFDSNKLPAGAARIADAFLNWRPHIDAWRGVGLIGPTNNGKSFLLHELGRRLWLANFDIFPTSGVEFGWICGSLDANRETYRNRCATAAVLLLDDADKLRLTDRTESDFYGILELRRRNHLPILATLNVGGDTLAGMGSDNRGAPIVTRLRDLCDFQPVCTP